MATPLRPSPTSENGSQGPEGLFISALLEIGEFNPTKYHIDDEDVEAWTQLWAFCREYQSTAGVAPPLSLVRKRFPAFTLTPDVDPTWAAYNLSMAAANRRLRMQIQETIKLLGDDDVPAAYAHMEALRRPRSLFKEPADAFDHSLVAEEFDVGRIEVPFPSLGRATGGIKPGELWLIGARLAHGKTWVLTRFLARAAACGYSVAYASLEMSSAAIARRIYVHLAGHDRRLLGMLLDEDVFEQKRAIDEIRDRLPKGAGIRIYDPSHGRINTTSAISSMAQDYELVCVDHVGLLMTGDHRRAIEDWRVQATISNVLREVTLESQTSIVGAAQVNREGATSSRRPPSTDKLSGSDALGQDADVVVMCKRTSERTMAMSAEKTRNGPGSRWYIEFNPGQGRFDEITKERATEMIALDDDMGGDWD